MNKVLKKENINYLITIISIILYLFLMFFSDITLDTGKKELENIILLAVPCFMLLFYSFNIEDKSKRKRILIFYLIFYLLAVIGFTFANFRDNVLIENNIMERGYNLIPFKSIKNLLNSPLGLKIAIYNILGNFLMLTPLAILLPLINDKLKKVRNYLLTIILLSLIIELTQYITKIGSLDIDDFILNVSGSIIIYLILIKTKLSYYLYHLFYEINIPKKISNTVYYIILILTFLIYIWYSSLIYIRYKENKVDFSNLKCISEEKTFLGTLGKYNYYSECKFEGYIKQGNTNILLSDLLNKFGSNIDNYHKELRLIRETSITNVEVILSKGTKKLIYNTDKQKKYLIDIEKISYYKNGVECVIDTTFPSNDLDCSANLVTVTKSDINEGYVISEGKYYNELSCIEGMYRDSKYIDYIVPKDYKLDEFSCNILK